MRRVVVLELTLFTSFSYYQAYSILREIGGTGEGNGPFMVIADGFAGLAEWADFMPGADRVAIDMHPYFAFNGLPNLDPVGVWAGRACERFSEMVNARYVSDLL